MNKRFTKKNEYGSAGAAQAQSGASNKALKAIAGE